MKNMKEKIEDLVARLFTFVQSEKGQTLVEYALLLVLIAIVVFIMLKGTGQQVNSVYSTINSALANP
jgi:pilus assembly protein Flp/PilA